MAASAVPFVVRPFVPERYEPRGRLGDYMRASGRDVADAIRANGATNAALVSGIGQNISGTLRDIAAYPELQRKQAYEQARMAHDEQVMRAQEAAAAQQKQKVANLQAVMAKYPGQRPPEQEVINAVGVEDAGHVFNALDQVYPKPKAQEPFTLNQGDVRFGPDGKKIAENPKPEPVQAKPRPVSVPDGGRLVNPETGEIIYTAPPKPEPRPLAREVVQGPDGPLLVNKDTGLTEPIKGPDGKPLRTALSAQERMDSRKFSKAAPVLRGIGELSEKINTQQGVIAKISGEAERQKAKLNLNDDVAEYEALVSGFTPMIARALGHTGVLTEQDVQSVKALFPRPGDSKSLRDRKINRMMSIIGELEGVEGVDNVSPKPHKKNPFRDQ